MENNRIIFIPEHMSLPSFCTCLIGVRVGHVITFLVPCCDVRYSRHHAFRSYEYLCQR
jgi:hypothetical protein